MSNYRRDSEYFQRRLRDKLAILVRAMAGESDESIAVSIGRTAERVRRDAVSRAMDIAQAGPYKFVVKSYTHVQALAGSIQRAMDEQGIRL